MSKNGFTGPLMFIQTNQEALTTVVTVFIFLVEVLVTVKLPFFPNMDALSLAPYGSAVCLSALKASAAEAKAHNEVRMVDICIFFFVLLFLSLLRLHDMRFRLSYIVFSPSMSLALIDLEYH